MRRAECAGAGAGAIDERGDGMGEGEDGVWLMHILHQRPHIT